VDNQTLILILIGVVVVLAAAIAAWIAIRARRSQRLREKYGPEYDYTVNKAGDRRMAEEALVEREKRVQKIKIQELDMQKAELYKAEWDGIQTDFVDRPYGSVEEADRLITEVMITRGFPVEDFERRAADISVLYPDVVINYRNAHAIAEKGQHNGVTTEDLRQAMVYYHSLFDELLETEKIKQKEVALL